MMTETAITIGDDTTVEALIDQLRQLDPRQRFLVQAILPDGTAWSSPARIFEVPHSNCGDGLSYLGLQIRCDRLPESPK